MEAVQKRTGMDGARSFLATRRGAVILAVLAAAIAGLLLIVFLDRYKSNVEAGTAPVTVLVADRLIPNGTSGDVLISERLFRPGSVAEADAKEGALTNAAVLEGTVAARDIYPGQQLTAADFTRGGDSLRGKLASTDRAIAVSLDTSRGLIGNIREGDRVDVIAGFNATEAASGRGRPVVRTILQDVLVLQAPSQTDETPGANDEGSVLLRVSDRQAAAVAFASDNGKVWLALRPPAGASESRPSSVSLEELLSGSPQITVDGGNR